MLIERVKRGERGRYNVTGLVERRGAWGCRQLGNSISGGSSNDWLSDLLEAWNGGSYIELVELLRVKAGILVHLLLADVAVLER